MSSHRRKIGKKFVIKKKNFTKHNVFIRSKKVIRFFTSINYKSTIKDVLNRLLYFFLIFMVFPITSIFIVGTLGKENLNYLHIGKHIFCIYCQFNIICKNYVIEI